MTTQANQSNGKDANVALWAQLKTILDNWERFTPPQVQVAAKLIYLTRPADWVTGEQQVRLDEAAEIIDELEADEQQRTAA